MSGWGDFKSCKALLDRVERNDPTLTSLNILPMKTFGDDEIRRLANIISSGVNSNLVALHASGHKVSGKSLEEFGSALNKASSNGKLVLTDLAFGDKNLGDDGVTAFVKGITTTDNMTGLTKIDFSSKSLTSRSWEALVNIFFSPLDSPNTNSLRVLNMSDNDLSGLISVPMTAVKHQVESLNLARCNLNASDVHELLVFLQSSQSSSIELILSGNNLIGPSISALAEVISKEKGKIKALKLNDCGICDQHLNELFCSGIGQRLQCIDLSGNCFEAASAINALASALSNSAVKDVILARNNLSLLSTSFLVSMLSADTCSVKYLDLAETNINSEGARSLFRIPQLEYLRLFNNNLGDGDFFSNPETALLLASSNLKTLDLCGNKVTNLCIFLSTLIEEYRKRDSMMVLEVLELGGNTISDSDEELINQLKLLGVDVAKDKPVQNKE